MNNFQGNTTGAPAPLAGLKILDLSRILAGPFCTQYLADMGAEVIKVERPGGGDDTRQWGPPFVNGFSAYFLACNRNKKSIAVNLDCDEGRRIIRGLAAQCDVVVENFKPGTMVRKELDYKRLRENNPGLILCSISAFGQDGEEAEAPGYDFIIQARAGWMSITGPSEGAPHKVGVALVDVITGLYAAGAILAALRHRDRTGEGQKIDISLFDAAVSSLVNVGMNYLVSGRVPPRHGNAHPNIVPYETFPTADGWIAVAAANDDQFRRLCGVLDLPELAQQPQYASNEARVKNREGLVARLREVFRQRPGREWLQRLQEAGIACSPIQNVAEVFSDPVVRERRMVRPVEIDGEPVQVMGPVPRFSHTPVQEPQPPPLLGQHTEDVLEQWLGYGKEEIARLRAAGAIP